MTNLSNTKSPNFSFNRYMVECEFRRTQLFIARGVSFNRYMVKCEYFNPAVVW